MIRVLIAAPSAILRAGLESIVRSNPAFGLAAEAGHEQPDVMLIDLEYAGEEPPPEVPAGAAVVLLTDRPPGAWTLDAFRSGARAVLPRDASASEIVAAIAAAAAGLAVLTPADLQALLPAALRAERARSSGSDEALTPREREVFTMLAEGAGNKTIAWRLKISEHTVKFHVASIMSKLNATSRTEAVALGIRKGLILL